MSKICGIDPDGLSCLVDQTQFQQCEFCGFSHKDSLWEIPQNSRFGMTGERTERDERSPHCRFGSVDGIARRSSEDPRPGPRDVLMRVRACSLNYRDLMVLKGGGRGPTKLGVIPLSDGAVEVAAAGERVTRVKEAATGITSGRFPN